MNGQYDNVRNLWVSTACKDACTCECEKDVILPDTYNDVKKILWYKGRLLPDEIKNSAGKVSFSGILTVSVMFLDEDGFAHCLNCPIEYSGGVSLECDPDDCTVVSLPALENLSVRTVNPRKIGIRARIDPSIRAWSEVDQTPKLPDFFTEDGDRHIQRKYSTATIGKLCGTMERDITLVEDMVLEKNMPSVDELLCSDAEVKVVSLNCGDGFVDVKLDVQVCSYYIGDNGEMQCYKKRIPISKIVEAKGVQVSSDIIVRAYVDKCGTAVSEDVGGQDRIISLDFRCSLAFVYTVAGEVSYITDLYSTGYESENRFCDYKCSSIPYAKEFSVSRNMMSACGEGAECVDVVYDIKQGALTKKDDGKYQTVRTDFFVCTKDKNGTVDCINLTENVDVLVEDCFHSITGLQIKLNSCKCENSSLMLSYDIYVNTLCWNDMNVNAVCAVNGSVTDKITKSRPITLYFPSAGESMWQIAKRYKTTVEALEAENSVESEHRCVVIPSRRALV